MMEDVPTPTFQTVFGAWLRLTRDIRGQNQQQFASQLGIAQSHLSGLEIGDHAPSSALIDNVLDRLNISVVDFAKGLAWAAGQPQPERRGPGRPSKKNLRVR